LVLKDLTVVTTSIMVEDDGDDVQLDDVVKYVGRSRYLFDMVHSAVACYARSRRYRQKAATIARAWNCS